MRKLPLATHAELRSVSARLYRVSSGVKKGRIPDDEFSYRKNDQAFVEQKNGAVIRQMVRYPR
ncbi:hypothetical protein ABIC02_007963 [Bradyrhizobium sp. RT5a]